jgi:hypothetical protein
MDGKIDRQKDSPWQTDKSFLEQVEKRLEGQTGRQVLAKRQVCHADRFAMQIGLSCRHVCHADRFVMQTGLPCRQVCHADRFAMQTGLPCRQAESSPVLTDNIHAEGLPRSKEK